MRTGFLLCVLVLLSSVAAAQTDGGVYGPAAPENAGFVRVAHADHTRGELDLPIGPRRFGPLSFGEVSPYRPLRAGIFLLRSGGAEAELIVQSDSYTTVLLGEGRITVVSDERHDDPARAQIVLYNARADGPVDLIVVPDGPPVFEGVAPGTSAARAVNAVTVRLAVRAGAVSAEPLAPIQLSRGNSFGVFVFDGESGIATRVHQARVVVGD